jgi:Ca2+-binding EF-hand superfamily protein
MQRLLVFASLAIAGIAVHAAAGQLTDAQIDPAFAKADVNRNGTLSPAEAESFGISSKAFHQANADKDGSLDQKEFAAAIGIQFAAANPDNDGTLNWKEARKAGVKSKKVFQQADSDKDGTLDMAEYLGALTAQAK